MSASTEQVRIQQLNLRGTATAIASGQAQLRTALDQTVWPATAPGEILLLRRIDASGNPREIAARAAVAASRLATGAVDGWSPAAPNALAVRFSSPANQTACLLRDLLQGTAAKHWYWRRWQQTLRNPVAVAITAVLAEAPLQLPAVIALLAGSPVWKPFWQTLGADGAAQLITVIARATGWQAVTGLLHRNASSDAKTETTIVPPAPTMDLTFLGCPSNDPRIQLAAILTLWQQAPALLSQTSAATPLRQLARVINGDTIESIPEAERSTTTAPSQNEEPDNKPTQPTDAANSPSGDSRHTEPKQIQPLQKRPTLPDASLQQVGKPSSEEKSVSSETQELPTASERPSQTSVLANRATITTDVPSPSTTPTPDGFITRQGGLLFLLNFFNLPAIRQQLPTDLPGAGWRWLYDLANALGCPPEGELLEFLARECGLRDGAELQTQPVTTPCAQLMRIGEGRYGAAVWQADTWRIPARLIASPSHIDLHLRLNDANPAVRRVGLDIDPGWLPWLGRVVTFHYGSGREP